MNACHVTVLADNIVYRSDLCAEAGLSLLIETEDGKIVLDTGQGIALANNLWELFPGLDAVDTIVFSHGHYDHTGGVGPLLGFLGLDADMPDAEERFPEIYLHPLAEEPKFSLHDSEYRSIGIPDDLTLYFPPSRIVKTREPAEMLPGVFFMGELPRTGFPAPYPPEHFFRKPQGKEGYLPDPLLDDTAVVVDTPDGLVVLSGCTHSGLGNLACAITERFPGKKVHAVMGGLHLSSADDDFAAASAEALKTMNPDITITLHCTGIRGYEYLKEHLSSEVKLGATGEAFAF